MRGEHSRAPGEGRAREEFQEKENERSSRIAREEIHGVEKDEIPVHRTLASTPGYAYRASHLGSHDPIKRRTWVCCRCKLQVRCASGFARPCLNLIGYAHMYKNLTDIP